jgi:hypothetical protein
MALANRLDPSEVSSERNLTWMTYFRAMVIENSPFQRPSAQGCAVSEPYSSKKEVVGATKNTTRRDIPRYLR